MFVDHVNQEPAEGDAQRESARHGRSGDHAALECGGAGEFAAGEAQGAQRCEFLAPVEQHAREREGEADDGHEHGDHFERIGNRKGLPENPQHLAAELGVGEDGEAGILLA